MNKSAIIKIKAYFVMFKMMLFAITLLLIVPFAMMLGGRNYIAGGFDVIFRYLYELEEIGYISKEEREEMENDLMN